MLKKYVALTAFELKQHLTDRAGLFWTFLFPVLLLFLLMYFYDGMSESHSPLPEFALCGDEVPLSRATEGLLEAFGNRVSIAEVEDVVGVDSGYLYVAKSGCTEAAEFEPGVSRFFGNSDYDEDVLAAVYGLRSVDAASPQYRVFDLTPASMSAEEFLSSGLIAMTLMSVCLFGVCLWIVQMRSKGVFRKYILYPIPSWLIISAFISSRAIGMLIYVLGFSLLTIYVTGVSIVPGNIPKLLAFVTLGIFCFISVGVFLSCALRSTAAASGVVSILNFFLSFVSDLYIPNDFMPLLGQRIVSFLPLHAFVDGARELAFGSGENGIAFSTLVIISWLLVSFMYSQRNFRWE